METLQYAPVPAQERDPGATVDYALRGIKEIEAFLAARDNTEELQIEAQVYTAENSPEINETEAFLVTLEDEQIEQAVRPERESNPQLDWPESGPNNIPTDDILNRRLNCRLSDAGFALDASLKHLTSEGDVAEWVMLKGAVGEAKSHGLDGKFHVVNALTEQVAQFVLNHGTTPSECLAERG